MRYYRYGKKDERDFETKEVHATTMDSRQFERLIIEEDTIYEIDEECMECLKKERNQNK